MESWCPNCHKRIVCTSGMCPSCYVPTVTSYSATTYPEPVNFIALRTERDEWQRKCYEIVAMLKPDPKINYECRFVDFCEHEDKRKLLAPLYEAALAIAEGRTE